MIVNLSVLRKIIIAVKDAEGLDEFTSPQDFVTNKGVDAEEGDKFVNGETHQLFTFHNNTWVSTPNLS